MNLKLRKTIYLSVLIAVVLAIIVLMYKGKYISAGILVFTTWGILFLAGAYGIPFHVKRMILKYIDNNDGKAEVTEIVRYCASRNKYFLEVGVRKWLGELESKKKIEIQDGIVTRTG